LNKAILCSKYFLKEHDRYAQGLHGADKNKAFSNTNDHDCSMLGRCDKWTKADFTYFNSANSTRPTFNFPSVLDDRWNCIDHSYMLRIYAD
jgi:hypothetical protein